MVLIFDTNTLMQRHYNLWELVEHFPTNQTAPKFLVAVDDGHLIENEYLKSAKTNGEESPIRIIAQRILDGFGLFVKRMVASISENTRSCLNNNGCSEDVDHCLLGLAEAVEGGILVCPNNIINLSIPRCYLKSEIQACVQADGKGPTILSLGEVLKSVREPHSPSPETLDDLKCFLSKFEIGEKQSEECGYVEFKCPKVPYLTQVCLREAVEAVCGMLNSCEGWVFIGVDNKTGEICPFPPKYNDASKKPSVDALLHDILDEINRIHPKPGLLVHFWPILDSQKEKCVIAIRVHQGNREYLYRDKNGKLQSMKWIRQGTSTIPDPNWDSNAPPQNQTKLQPVSPGFQIQSSTAKDLLKPLSDPKQQETKSQSSQASHNHKKRKREWVNIVAIISPGKVRVSIQKNEELICMNIPPYPPPEVGQSFRADVIRTDGRVSEAIFKGWR
jgi:hypothetical protein